MAGNNITIRECVSVEDFRQCVELERGVWKDEDIDVMPVRLYMISKACDSPTIGAFDESGQMVGFVHTMIALKGKNIAFHSHMLAVTEDQRDKSIGYKIKLAQRDRAIKAGIQLIYWTFDPLQSRNAHFNINKLGAVIKRYEENYYGDGFSSIFDKGVPSDRLIAEWWVSSPYVKSVLAGASPSTESLTPGVEIPDDINEIRTRSMSEHRQWRFAVRDDFVKSLSFGHIVRGFGRDSQRARGTYFSGPDEAQFNFDYYGPTQL